MHNIAVSMATCVLILSVSVLELFSSLHNAFSKLKINPVIEIYHESEESLCKVGTIKRSWEV